ncbi:hypothetical protein M441DRAFT_360442 [Trichoderma asperellum CBS 433.97]|uniref:Uncharacterized protein n=1 Tax=Trichoderma asperellum (strain ATCC 204424 / CBS 433.97 / NBRC 101777) TaxID=1042311 RepID=A0A2T3ZDJ9_TRIA4|nr:hypothetical protein M441DRAFT_360442 [Trichoderma asperellum CBS 433.97]PTB42864.1 hypothetical protein M441DRAFT_360442 [Trichoderma asperellum CBS 433.97]
MSNTWRGVIKVPFQITKIKREICMSPDEVPSTLTGALTGPPIQSSPHMPAPCLLPGGVPFLPLFSLGGVRRGPLYPKPATTKQTTTGQTPLACQFRQILIPMLPLPLLLLRYIFFFLLYYVLLPYLLPCNNMHACTVRCRPLHGLLRKGNLWRGYHQPLTDLFRSARKSN